MAAEEADAMKERRPSANGRFLEEQVRIRAEQMTPEERLAEALRLHQLAFALRRAGQAYLAGRRAAP
jgi:putative lipoic acid-binding regulatory protein